MHVSAKNAHIRSHLLWVAQGGTWHPSDLESDLKIDLNEVTRDELAMLHRLAADGSKRAKALYAGGHQGDARKAAEATAAAIAKIVGDRIVPERKLDDGPQDPRSLAARIRRSW